MLSRQLVGTIGAPGGELSTCSRTIYARKYNFRSNQFVREISTSKGSTSLSIIQLNIRSRPTLAILKG
jgi:hypothetical protein